jgi:two-component system, probable response regulator PhcQ
MQNPDYRRYLILYVDDEERSLKSFQRAFGDLFRVLTAHNAAEGWKLFEAHADEIAVLMTDQRMPGEKGVWLLDKARQLRPGVIRILATAFADMEATIAAVNAGAIYQYVSKPWDPPALENTLKHAVHLFTVQRERDDLLREKMAVLHNMMIADRVVSLGFMAAGMSHHMRNALVAAKTFIDLVPQQLREEGVEPTSSKNPEFWTEYQKTAQICIRRMDDLLKELWAVAETRGVAFTDHVHLRDVTAETVLLLRDPLAEKGISVEIAIPDSFPVLTVDKEKFSRMLELIIKDEIISLPEGSRITIAAAPADRPDFIGIAIRDNGPGLSAEILETLFDPFNTRSDSPSEHGINLMSCYFIAHYHGGKIEARNAADGGTEFLITLPRTPNRAVASPSDGELFRRIRQTDEMWQRLVSSR